jgi:hypothetical protein
MQFPEWFQQRWREPGEAETRAIQRLCIATGCGDPTIRRALNGEAMSPNVARRLVVATDGEVLPVTIVFPENSKGAA